MKIFIHRDSKNLLVDEGVHMVGSCVLCRQHSHQDLNIMYLLILIRGYS